MSILFLLITALLRGPAPAPAANSSTDVPVIKLPELKKLMAGSGDTTVVINFWATWCKPCVGELPAFDSLKTHFAGEKLKIVLVSLDFVKDRETRLIPFLKKQGISHPVYLLNEPDYNSWIDVVAPSWGGSIPGTLIVNKKGKYRQFFEKEFTPSSLIETVRPVIRK